MQIALVKAPWWVRYCPPYILAYFATYLRQHGHDVAVFDLNNLMYHAAAPEHRKYWDDRDYYSFWENSSCTAQILADTRADDFVDKILATGARLIAFDTHTPSMLISYAIAQKIKRRAPDSIILFFGHKSGRAQAAYDFIRNPDVDYVCPGEADLAFLELLKRLETAKPSRGLPGCPGFLSRRSDGVIVDGGDPGVSADLDALPFPDYRDFADDIENRRYSLPNRLDILDSRGCINTCHFCYERLFWPRYRAMSGQRIFEQVQYHMRQFPRIDYFYFNGLLMNGSLKSLEQFCDLVIGSGIKIRWAGQAIVRGDMTGALLDKMKRAGCEWLGYGIESGSQRVLDSMNKRFRIDQAVRVLKDTKEAGIGSQVNIMFGFPTETEEDFRETLRFLEEARPYIDSILASQSFFTLEKETYLRTHAEEFGITNAGHHLFWKADNGRNNYAERFRRYEEFCRRAIALGIPETSGVLSVKPDKWCLLGQYYQYEKDYAKAAECYRKSLDCESDNEMTRSLLAECSKKNG